MANNYLQGSSDTTVEKQEGLVGIHYFNTLSKKNWGLEVGCFDLFCGSGKNYIKDIEIYGSPISTLEGIRQAIYCMRGHPSSVYGCVFSDIAPGRATKVLPNAIQQWIAENKIIEGESREFDEYLTKSILIPTRSNGPIPLDINFCQKDASTMLPFIDGWLSASNNRFASITIDPNGPKHIPWDLLLEIREKHKKRTTIIFHIAANHLKRVFMARASTGFNFAPMPDHVADLLARFGKQPCGWVRKPKGKDEWTIIMLCPNGQSPMNGWEKKDFHLLNSDQGKLIVNNMSLVKRRRLVAECTQGSLL